MSTKKNLLRSGLAIALVGLVASTQAAPLPNGTVLTIEPGNATVTSIGCSAGSCFVLETAAGYPITVNIVPGTDGGLIVGKSQTPGGQEGAGGGALSTSGQLSAAFFFFGNYGSFATSIFSGATAGSVTTDALANLFDDSTCTDVASCTGKTTLGTWNGAWNSTAIPFGSALGCLSTTNDFWCIGVANWTVIPSPATATSNSTYALHHDWVVPDGDPSGWGNVHFALYLRGRVILPPNAPPVANAGADQTVVSGNAFSLTGSCTDGSAVAPNISSCAWTLPAGATCTESVSGIGTSSAINTLSCSGIAVTTATSFNFTLTATDTGNLTSSDSAVVTVRPSTCTDITPPMSTFTTNGGGQSSTVNATLTETFTGHIVSYTNTSITICNGTPLIYEATSTAGNAICTVSGSPTASTGAVRAGDKLICTNKPTGQDTDRFRILGQ